MAIIGWRVDNGNPSDPDHFKSDVKLLTMDSVVGDDKHPTRCTIAYEHGTAKGAYDLLFNATTDNAYLIPCTPVPNSSSSTQSPLAFHGYPCAVDCKDQEIGYAWAQEHNVTSEGGCPTDPHGNHAFTQGCWAYAGREGPER